MTDHEAPAPISTEHAETLAKAAIPLSEALSCGIRTVRTAGDLASTDVDYPALRGKAGLLFPLRRPDGTTTYQLRLDQPDQDGTGRWGKYIQAKGIGSVITVPTPAMAQRLTEGTATRILIVEGTKQAIAAALNAPDDTLVLGVQGCLNWLKDGAPTTELMGVLARTGADRAYICFDADFSENAMVYDALRALVDTVSALMTTVMVVKVPGVTSKAGLDDFLGTTPAEKRPFMLNRLIVRASLTLGRRPKARPVSAQRPGRPATVRSLDHESPFPISPVEPIDVAAALTIFRRWLGEAFDPTAQLAVWAGTAAHELTIDPCWLMVVSGSGAGKTEAVVPLRAMGAHAVSTISGVGALLSATSEREVSEQASGGLLRDLGDSAVLVIKDFTSILEMSGDSRSAVIAAVREVYDGQWSRVVGSDGGKQLDWSGRVTIITACTTKWDEVHSSVAALGDRFLLVRLDSTTPATRTALAMSALSAAGREAEMRADLGGAVAALFAGVNDHAGTGPDLTKATITAVMEAADLLTRARTAAIRSIRGEVENVHAPEAPTRVAKQLRAVVEGAMRLGLSEPMGLRVALRVARDSMPPVRARVLTELGAVAGPQSVSSLSAKTGIPRSTLDRELIALGLLDLVNRNDGGTGTSWQYSLATRVNLEVLQSPDVTLAELTGSPEVAEPRATGDVDRTVASVPMCEREGFAEPGEPSSPPNVENDFALAVAAGEVGAAFASSANQQAGVDYDAWWEAYTAKEVRTF